MVERYDTMNTVLLDFGFSSLFQNLFPNQACRNLLRYTSYAAFDIPHHCTFSFEYHANSSQLCTQRSLGTRSAAAGVAY